MHRSTDCAEHTKNATRQCSKPTCVRSLAAPKAHATCEAPDDSAVCAALAASVARSCTDFCSACYARVAVSGHLEGEEGTQQSGRRCVRSTTQGTVCVHYHLL